MKKKTQEWIERKYYPILRKVSHRDFSDEWVGKVSSNTVKVVNFLYGIITAITLIGTFTWFFPKILKIPYETTITILLCLIILHLRYGKTTIEME